MGMETRNHSDLRGQGRYTHIRPEKRLGKHVKDHRVFNCYYNSNPQDTMQGILYKDGSCLIGIDVWRLLNRMDTCQYRYRRYDSIEKANVTQVNIPKGYYMEK